MLEVEPARSNILRSLTIDQTSIALEIGAGAGALSRYLGETVALLDTIEPRDDLAAIAAERLADLDSVRVFTGTIDDVPAEPVYDLIVAVDQLRVAGLSAHSWLGEVRSRLAPGGTLVLAESNRLGTKYLVGSPDDESKGIFDSIEGYSRGEESQALTRPQMVELLDGAGFVFHLLAALPDHRSTRVVLDPSRLSGELVSLASDLAIAPSPDYFALRPKLADESRVWQQLVAAGLAAELANSFVIVATTERESVLWEADRVASYHSWQRSAEYTSQTDIHLDAGGAIFSRHYPRADSFANPLVRDSSYRYVHGRTLASAMVGAPDEQIALWLARWKALVSELADGGQLWLDLHPGNLILDDSDQLSPIDLEFAVPGSDIDFTIRRGVLVLARTLAAATHPSRWSTEISTVGDIALKLGGLMGYGPDRQWFETTLDDEAKFQQTVAGARATGKTREEWRHELETVTRTPLDDLPLGLRVYEAVDRIAAERDAAHERLGVFDKRIRELEDSLELEAVGHIAAERDAAHQRLDLFDKRIQELEHSLARELAHPKSALSNHIASLETRIQEQSEAFQRTEVELRNTLHHAHLADLALRSSRTYRLALRLQTVSGEALPLGSRRRRAASRIFAIFRAKFR